MLLRQVREYVEKYNMLNKGDRIVVGISGGADSVCLLYVLSKLAKEYDFVITAVHVHHGIRGKEADRDMNYTKDFCKSLGVNCEVYYYDVPAIAKKRGITVEEAGRNLRYETFYDVLKKTSSNKIAVAHNLGDNCETILFNLCRGSELKGISGIPPIRDSIIRPLLFTDRKDIEEYLRQNNIEYIVDSTNLENDYIRNKIRNIIIPYITENINSKAVSHIAAAGQSALEAEEYINEQVEAFIDEYIKKDSGDTIIKKEIKDESPIIIRRLIRKAFEIQSGKLKDVTSSHIKDIMDLFDNNVSKSVNLPYGIEAVRTYDGVKLTKINKNEKAEFVSIEVFPENEYECGDNKKISLKIIKKDENFNQIKEKLYTKWFDCAKIKDTVRIRTRMPGDYLIVDSKGSKKKLKEYFINEKIPKEERNNILLLADGSHIMWIIGYRISEYYKVTDETINMLEAELI